MSVIIEAIVLPVLFLTVTLLGGLRVAEPVRLVPPPLTALVLAMVLVAALARAGVLRADRLMNTMRTPLENVSGLVVLLTLFAGSAQILHMLIPDTGLLHVIFSIFLFVQLTSTMAAGTRRAGLIRSLVILLGSAFVLRWIVLESLYAPAGGALKRVLTALAEGVTLGALDYAPHAPITGYIAFFALVMYLTGLALLSPVPDPHDMPLALRRHTTTGRDLVLLVLMVILPSACGNPGAPEPLGSVKAGVDTDGTAADTGRAVDRRNQALRSAKVWSAPAIPVSEANLGENPPGGFRSTDEVTCRFVLEAIGGTTSKFNCQLPDGEIVKVKYGGVNPEIHAETAATRLLAALGFGADSIFVVRKVRCAGCPTYPFQALKCYSKTGMRRACFPGGIDYNEVVEFDPAVIERRLDGKKIEAVEDQGWAWFELEQIDPAHGGASREEVDALRLVATLLAHWDNKSANQRLVCPAGGERPDGSCPAPLAIMHDLGATFGPLKVDLRNWRSVPVWSDAATCTVSMKTLPWGGSTFPDRRISEGGRQLLLGLLEQLSDAQLNDLFLTSRISDHNQVSAEARDPGAWVAVFRQKVRQIRNAGPCPG